MNGFIERIGKNIREKQKEKLHKFWKQPKPQGNIPEEYQYAVERSEFLYDFIKDEIPKDAVICEIGCNVGRNLNYLYKKGYTNLIGIEISEHACKIGKEIYDVKWQVINKPIEEAIKDIKCDCYFTMAVLEHITFASEWIFKEMEKAKWIVTIEDEQHGQISEGNILVRLWRKLRSSPRHFNRHYDKVFSSHTQIKHENCRDNGINDPTFEARLLKKQ